MLVAAGQFAVTSVWEKNAEICASLMAQAAENDVSLFVLPEALLALAQALQGAEILVLPAAWVRGPLKEHHWSTLLAARALDTTCYMVAAGECGNKNIGQSRIIDPFGVTIAAASEMPALIMAEVTPERVRQVRAQLPVLNNRRFAPPQLL
ncbi:hypothetical protein ITM28_002167 [Escherichia coli]|nr:hypothetical protein [Escherichia coli]